MADDLDVVVARKEVVAGGVVGLTLRHPDGAPVPEWEPGAHVDLVLRPTSCGSTPCAEIRRTVPSTRSPCCSSRRAGADHRDSLLTPAEREPGDVMMICVSRARGGGG